MVTDGGEVSFVKRMIDESLLFKDRVSVYTSMLGKKSSLKPLVHYLRNLNIFSIFTTELKQGKTSRWAIAWTFSRLKQADDTTILSAVKSTMTWNVNHMKGVNDVMTGLKQCLSSVSFVSAVSVDHTTATISGVIREGDNEAHDHPFTIQIVQRQSKQFVVQFKSGNRSVDVSANFSQLANILHKLLQNHT